MKLSFKIILFLICTILLETTYAQRQAKLIGQEAFIFETTSPESDSLKKITIDLKLADIYLDTCSRNNSLIFEFYLVNKTAEPILYNPTIYFYDDSRFGSGRYPTDLLKPSKRAKVKFKILNTMRWAFHNRGRYIISYKGKEVDIPIKLGVNYRPKSCGPPKIIDGKKTKWSGLKH